MRCRDSRNSKIQDLLTSEFKITTYDFVGKGRTVLFGGPVAPLNINLILDAGHINTITSLTAAFACGYYCDKCYVPYHVKNEHRCEGTCPARQQSHPCEFENKITCVDCNRWFRNTQCYENHKKGAPNSICNTLRCCSNCLRIAVLDRKHVGGQSFCKICKKHIPQDHMCTGR